MAHLTNPLATPSQLFALTTLNSPLPPDLQHSIRFYTARLTQAAGILLRLPQDITAQANVLLYRYWVVDRLLAWEFSVCLPSPSPQLLFGGEVLMIGGIGRLSSCTLSSSQNLGFAKEPAEYNERLRVSAFTAITPLTLTNLNRASSRS